jgi:RNA polymerase sigma-70 factor, ECF subfamily
VKEKLARHPDFALPKASYMSEPRSLWPLPVIWEDQTESPIRDAAPEPAAVRTVAEQVELHFAELSDAIFRYLVFAIRDASDAEELTQEAFIRLYRELARGQTIVNVRQWIFKVSRNLMLDHLKSVRRHARRIGEMPEHVEDIARCLGKTPEEALLETSRMERLGMAMKNLTPTQRECVELRSRGLRLREIGEVLDMDLRRVAEALSRAVLALQRELDA